MFRSARWRNEKNKIKTVFKLQFHATQVSQLVADALVVSVVPGDSTKHTSRVEKASIRDGICKWETPLYETVKFNRDPKSGKITERIYHFIISTGAAKSTSVGEVSIDFADYAEITKTSSLSLPLKNSSSNVILHVSILRLQENVDQRENEDSKVEVRDKSLRSIFSNSDIDESPKISSTELDEPIGNAESNVNFSGSSISDLTLSSLDSSSELNTPRGNAVPSNDQQGPNNLSMDGAIVLYNFDNDNERPAKGPDIEIDKLKSEVSALTRLVDTSDMELQSLRKQVVKESRRSQDLLREIACLREERDRLKSLNDQTNVQKSRLHYEVTGDMSVLLEELNYEKNLNADLRLQLQKTQESNSELIIVVKDLDGLLEQKEKEISNLSRKFGFRESSDDEEQKALEEIVNDQRNAKENYILEQRVLDLSSEVEIYRRDRDELEMQIEQIALDYEILKQKHHEVLYKWEQSQMQEQLKLQYESAPSSNLNEMVEKIKKLENELASQSVELSDSLATIKELQSRVVILEDEMEKKADEFENDLAIVTRAKVESEQRAIQAEVALKKMKWKNVNTAEKLQEEFKRLSLQMAASFDANERVAMKALKEAAELRDENRSKAEQIKNMVLEIDKKSKQAKLCDELEKEIENLKDEILRVTQDNDLLSKELRRVKELSEEAEMAVLRENAEKNKLENEVNQLKKQLMESMLDLKLATQVKDEREEVILDLESQRERLGKRCDGFKRSMLEDETEIEKLRKQVSDQKDDLKGKEADLSSFEKKLEEATLNCNEVGKKLNSLEGQIKIKEAAMEDSSLPFLEKERHYKNKIDELKSILDEEHHPSQMIRYAMQVANGDTISELELMKERNEFMEIELKEMQEKYSEISLKFAEVEGERQKLVMTVRNLKNAKKKS